MGPVRALIMVGTLEKFPNVTRNLEYVLFCENTIIPKYSPKYTNNTKHKLHIKLLSRNSEEPSLEQKKYDYKI